MSAERKSGQWAAAGGAATATSCPPCELDVVRLVVSGKTDKEIGRALARSPDTIAA